MWSPTGSVQFFQHIVQNSILNNGVFIAIIAHGTLGLSLIWDKILLLRPETKNVVNYVFWLGAMSILGLLLIPFGFHWPMQSVIWIGLGAGLVSMAANYFYYATLNVGEASQTLAIVGGFAPLFTYLISIPLLAHPLEPGMMVAFVLMVIGGFFMFLSEAVNLRQILPLSLSASAAFGLSNVMQKVVFNETNFVTGYVFFTFGTFAGAMLFLVRASWRQQVFHGTERASVRSKELYFLNRFISGVGSFLIFFAISRASPAIVDSIAGLRYALIFVGVWLITRYHPQWLREQFSGWPLTAKVIGTGLITAGLVLLGLHNHSAS